MRFPRPILLAALTVAALATPCRAQAVSPEDDGPIAWLVVKVERGRPTEFELTARDGAHVPAVVTAARSVAADVAEHDGWDAAWTHIQWTQPAPKRDGLTLEQTLTLSPVLAALADAGQRHVTVVVTHPRAAHAELAGATVHAREPHLLNATISTQAGADPTLRVGWQTRDLVTTVLVLFLVLVLPLKLALAIRERSRANDRVPTQWFERMLALNAVALFGWAGWLVAVEATRAPDLLAFVTPERGVLSTVVLPALLWIVPFLIPALAIVSIGRSIARRLRGDDGEPPRVLNHLRALAPLVLLMLALPAFATGEWRFAVFSILGAVGCVMLLPAPSPALGASPQALSSGALRDTLFGFAARAGIKLRELYVVPMRRQRLANAFAAQGGMVLVGDVLLDRMSRREVNAVLAHEITHLEHHHPFKMVLAGLAGWVVVTAATTFASLPFGLPIGFLTGWFLYVTVARRSEFSADAGAAALTSDPEAMISALGRLARLNDVPLDWGRWTGMLLTHPTTAARATALARRAGIPAERMRALLEHGLDDAERYGAAERPGEEARVFSTAYKQRAIGRLSFGLLAASVAAPALAIAISRALGFAPPALPAVVAGAALAVLATLWLQDVTATLPVRRLERAVRERFGGGLDATFVTLSPGDRARIHEGFADWDLGIVTLEPEWLRYRGEQVAIDLPRAAVHAIELGAGFPHWIRTRRVVVRWTSTEGDTALTLRPAGTRRLTAIARDASAFAVALRRWRSGNGQRAGTIHPAVTPAPIGAVTSLSPAEATAPRDLPLLVVSLGALSAGMATVLSLGFTDGACVFAAALIGLLALRWPAMTSREPATTSVEAPAADQRAA